MRRKSLNSLNMFWIEFKHIKLLFITTFFLFTVACSSEEKKSENVKNDNSQVRENNSLTEEEKIIRQVENKLDISAAENYDFQIEYQHINRDTLKDALILVNRKDYAFKQAKSNDTEKFFESTGHTGPYNYLFLKLGGKKKLISTAPVGSNAEYPLKVNFLELTSKAHLDFYVEYRIRNSKHRNYYTLRNNSLFLTFSCPVFDNIGEPNPRVYDIEHPESSVRISKDIALYEGEIVDYKIEEISDVNNYTPKVIKSTGELIGYFIFDDQSMKYKTPMPALED